MTQTQSVPRRRPWGRVVLAGLLVIALLVGVGAVVAERMVRERVESGIAAQLGQELGATTDVTIDDQIVLWSLANDRLDKVNATAKDAELKMGDRNITLSSINGTFTNLTKVRDQKNTVIGNLDITGVISWTEAGEQLGLPMTYVGEGRVEVRQVVKVLGAELPIVFSAIPGVDSTSGRFTLTSPKADLGAVNLPSGLLGPVADQIAARVVLPTIQGVHYESLTANSEGLALRLTGKDLPLSSLR